MSPAVCLGRPVILQGPQVMSELPWTGPESFRMRLTSDLNEVCNVRKAGEKIALAIGFSAEQAAMIMLTIDEALANVIQHGYDGQKGRPIDVFIERICPEGRVGIRVSIRDRAKQVDPASIKGRDLDDVRPGGLGVHLIKSLMDEVVHRPTGEGMELEMVKYLESD